MVKCRLCGEEVLNLPSHLRDFHFMSYSEYYETMKMNPFEGICWKCGLGTFPLSPLLPGISLPCLHCISDLSLAGIEERRQVLFRHIKDYQLKIGRSKFYQYLLSLDSLSCLYPRNIESGVSVLSSLKDSSRLRIERDSVIEVESRLGALLEISQRNIQDLEMHLLDVMSLGDLCFSIGSNQYEILLPESIPYDTKHHSRHSILNPGSKRNTKRLRMKGSSRECIKFFGSSSPIKSIFKLIDMDTREEKGLEDFTDKERSMIKQIILSSRVSREILMDIYNEIIPYTRFIMDNVFLKNSILIPSQKDLNLYFTWTNSEIPSYIPDDGDHIKLTVL